MGFDNSNIAQKVRIRNRVFDYPVSFAKGIEFFAGKGEMTRRIWSKVCQEVVCIDKKPAENITHVGNNNDFVHLAEHAEIIDCDAYGLVLQFIKKIRDIAKCQQIIFFTDGTPKKNKALRKKIDFEGQLLSLCPQDYHFEKAIGGNVYYGFLYFNGIENV